MKLTKVKLIGLETYDLPIIGAKLSDPYICKGIDGLGPTELDLFLSDNASEGASFEGRRARNREIIARIGLNSNYILGESPSDLRQALYGLITPGSNDGRIDIELLQGETVMLKTYGWVKKFEAPIWTKEPEVQVTIDSPEPYLLAPDSVSITSDFEIENVGTAPSGLLIDLSVTADVETITLGLGGQSLVLDDKDTNAYNLDEGFENGDHLVIDTNFGSRSIVFERDSVEYSGLYLMAGNWLQLRGGINTLTVDPAAGVTINSVEFTPKYWGI